LASLSRIDLRHGETVRATTASLREIHTRRPGMQESKRAARPIESFNDARKIGHRRTQPVVFDNRHSVRSANNRCLPALTFFATCVTCVAAIAAGWAARAKVHGGPLQAYRVTMAKLSFRLRLVLGLATAILLDTAVQIFWKIGVIDIPDSVLPWELLGAVAERPIFLLVLALMLAQLFNWLHVLSLADLSFAKPFTSLSYVTVGTVSAFFLGERLNIVQIAGIGIIIAGVWFVSRSRPVEA
jgi:drug/metabolite transporter (DMT)-like permease